MKSFKFLGYITVMLVMLFSAYSTNLYNTNGDFTIEVGSLKDKIYNDNITTDLSFIVKNNKAVTQSFRINLQEITGWNSDINFDYFTLNPNEQKTINIELNANNDFDYTENVISPDTISITQKSDYTGYFEFPIIISGDEQNVSLRYQVNIDKKEIKETPISFNARISNSEISPKKPLGYSITASNINTEEEIDIKVTVGNYVLNNFKDQYDKIRNYKVYQSQISSEIVPGKYPAKITVRYTKEGGSVEEWSDERNVVVESYQDLSINEKPEESWYKDLTIIKVTNNGNIKAEYAKNVNINFLQKLLFSSNTEYEVTDKGIRYNIELERGESKTITYSVNYLIIYVLMFVAFILIIYIYIRKSSNPLDVKNEMYEIKKVPHEGVKSLKLRIGFENIKAEEIDEIKVIFRMPSYLQVKENSFLLTEPKHAFKGKDQFKLIWDFKRFEKNDSRIIGFTLINAKGVLGDIKIPDLEFEVKQNGKVRKYYSSFPTIKG